MARMRLLFTFTCVGFLAAPVFGEKVNMSPEALRKTATHVLVGTVTAVYDRQERAGDNLYTHHLAEVRVVESEKGDGLKKGDLAYVRYWNKQWVGKGDPPPDTSGHRGCPAVGDTVRIYLAKNAYDGFSTNNKDGGYNVIGANGFETVKEKGP